MNPKQQVGVIAIVAAVAASVWSVVTRYTGIMGQLHSWRPPFTSYEVITIGGALAALLFLLVGLRPLGVATKRS